MLEALAPENFMWPPTPLSTPLLSTPLLLLCSHGRWLFFSLQVEKQLLSCYCFLITPGSFAVIPAVQPFIHPTSFIHGRACCPPQLPLPGLNSHQESRLNPQVLLWSYIRLCLETVICSLPVGLTLANLWVACGI